jgi:hypothetical protein
VLFLVRFLCPVCSRVVDSLAFSFNGRSGMNLISWRMRFAVLSPLFRSITEIAPLIRRPRLVLEDRI